MALTDKRIKIMKSLLEFPSGSKMHSEITPKVSPADRKALKDAGLVDEAKRDKILWLQATEAGLSWTPPAETKSPKTKKAAKVAKSKSPTEAQTLILWALLVKPDWAAVETEFKLKSKAKDRQALKSLGFIIETESEAAASLEVSEKGWSWATEHLDAKLPAGHQILRAWLSGAKRLIDQKRLALNELLEPPSAKNAQDPPKIKIDLVSLSERVRAAYLACTGGAFNQRLFLSQLREKLPEIDRADLNETLIEMNERNGFSLTSSDNPAELTTADKEARIDYKGIAMYAIWMTK